MKKIVFIILLTFFAVSDYAQKSVDVDNSRFVFTFRQFPQKPLNPMFFHYTTRIVAPNNLVDRIDLDGLYQKFVIEGQRRVEEPQPDDVTMVLNMGTLNIESSDIKEFVSESKDKEGKVTSRKYSYAAIVTYSFEATTEIFQGNKRITAYVLYSRMKPLVFQSDFYDTSRKASEYWKNNRENLLDKFSRELTSLAVDKARTNASLNFGFTVGQTSDIIKTIDEKKHPENNAFRAASDQLKQKLQEVDAYTPLSEDDVTDLIDYFKSIPSKYTDLKLKADIRLRYAAYYNLCKIYLYLDQPQNVKQYADLIFENGHDKGDCKKMNEEADKLAKLLNARDIKSRHFNPDDYFTD
jgi:hypothetical protein